MILLFNAEKEQKNVQIKSEKKFNCKNSAQNL